MGVSVTSDVGNGGIILAIPKAPLNLSNRPAITTATQIGLIWDVVPVVDNGGIAVEDYKVYMAIHPSNDYSTIGSGITVTTFIAENLSPRVTYTFKVSARNDFGYSPNSTVVSILAAQMPDRPNAPTTSLSRTKLIIDWDAPFD